MLGALSERFQLAAMVVVSIVGALLGLIVSIVPIHFAQMVVGQSAPVSCLRAPLTNILVGAITALIVALPQWRFTRYVRGYGIGPSVAANVISVIIVSLSGSIMKEITHNEYLNIAGNTFAALIGYIIVGYTLMQILRPYAAHCAQAKHRLEVSWTLCTQKKYWITTSIHITSGSSETPDIHIEADNPLCGDKLWMDLHVKDGVVEDVRFSGRGCAISQAAASMLTDRMVGKRLDDLASTTRATSSRCSAWSQLRPHEVRHPLTRPPPPGPRRSRRPLSEHLEDELLFNRGEHEG